MKPSSWRISNVCGVPRSQKALKPKGLVPVARSMLATLCLYDSRSCSDVMEYCAAHVCPWPDASCPRWTISFARAGWRSTVAPTMWEVTLTFRRSNMSNNRGSPSLNPYSYHLSAGRSGYFGSIDGMGDSAPLDGCAPASICMEIEITIRAPSGQKELLDSAGGREIGDLALPKVSGSKV